MFVAIVGTRFAGKSSVEEYLVHLKGFTAVRLVEGNDKESMLDGTPSELAEVNLCGAISGLRLNTSFRNEPGVDKHQSFLSMSPLPSPAIHTTLKQAKPKHPLCFSSPADLLLFVTNHWQENFVTCDLTTRSVIEMFIRRPFFMLLNVDAPLINRFMRCQSTQPTTLEDFVRENDRLAYGPGPSLHDLKALTHLEVINAFTTLEDLHAKLDLHNLLNPEYLRPSWDSYFMTLASLASRRSNCMKRRVGAVIVRDNRVIATGYNGTPRGLINCSEGGCDQCNGSFPSMSAPIECVCLHAEENALLEAGRERIGPNAVLYCNTCPCLKCTVKIIQTGVKTVVYNLAYKMDTASARLFEQSGVELRRYDPQTIFHPINEVA